MLFPLSESGLLQLDLFSKPLPQRFLFLAVLWIIQLFNLWFAKFASFHLREAVGFIVLFFRGGNQVKHICADKKGSELFEVTVVFILNCRLVSQRLMTTQIRFTFCNTPQVLSTLDNPPVRCCDILGTTNN